MNTPPSSAFTSTTLRESELRADVFGFMTALATTRSYHVAGAGMYGLALYLTGLELDDQASWVYEGSPPRDSVTDYPTTKDRIMEIFSALDRWSTLPDLPEGFAEETERAARACNLIRYIWRSILPILGSLRMQLAEFDPVRNPGFPSEIAANAVVTILWQHVDRAFAPR